MRFCESRNCCACLFYCSAFYAPYFASHGIAVPVPFTPLFASHGIAVPVPFTLTLLLLSLLLLHTLLDVAEN